MAAPRCPHCNATGLKYLAAREVNFYNIVYCRQCGAIHGIVPRVQKPKNAAQKSSSPKTSSAPDKQQSSSIKPAFLQEIGYADLSKKVPYSPEKMASRMRAAGRGQITPYMRIAADEGPPICIRCKIEMRELTIPAGYPNEGAKIWLCPNYDECKLWELAE